MDDSGGVTFLSPSHSSAAPILMNTGELGSGGSEWPQLRRLINLSGQPAEAGGGGVWGGGMPPVAESTVVTTTLTPASSPAMGGDRMPIAEGRVGKTGRRRSRASRKAPTTVLNTDTTNFRAMVQQFTGVPSAPFPAGYPYAADGNGGGVGQLGTIGFGLGGNAALLHQQPAVFPFGIQQQFQQQYERPLFLVEEGPGGDEYLRGPGGDNPLMSGIETPERLLLARISRAQAVPRPAASTGSTASDGFFL